MLNSNLKIHFEHCKNLRICLNCFVKRAPDCLNCFVNRASVPQSRKLFKTTVLDLQVSSKCMSFLELLQWIVLMNTVIICLTLKNRPNNLFLKLHCKKAKIVIFHYRTYLYRRLLIRSRDSLGLVIRNNKTF